MKKLLSTLILLLGMAAGASALPYDTVPGDPLKARIYTLPNGLKVMTTVNKDAPRIQTYIAVRVGGKNDPAETTGLAHYFEHLMFKGTPNYGTSDYAAERPLLDCIEEAFEIYRRTTDPAERTRIYARIDSLSYAASLIAIPNEYDKLMSAIGAQGSNAFTSMDVTCYTEDIPSNQIENWAKVQADRFIQPVLRGFHTELETIYEEKNMSMKSDSEKAVDALQAALFPTHPYGTQTVLGTQEHLKNPSIRNVRLYHDKWYVPNNMAVILSGDFDPDEAVAIVEKYFGGMTPNPSLDYIQRPSVEPLSASVEKSVAGQEAPFLYMGWRIPGTYSEESPALELMGSLFQNGYSGLIDRNITLPQRALSAGVFPYLMSDAGIMLMLGQPKAGQTMQEVRDLLLAQADSLREGRFSDSLLDAVKTNVKLRLQQQIEDNSDRVSMLLESFVSRQPWAKTVGDIAAVDTISKDYIVALARKYLTPDGYAVIYKKQGEDNSVAEIAKPKITPIATNRDAASAFLTEVVGSEVEPIEPRFVDFKKDLTFLTAKGDTPVYYSHNSSNDIFNLTFVYETGTTAIPTLDVASDLLEFAATPTMSAAQIQEAFYSLGCRYAVQVGGERTYVIVSGLAENMTKALDLFDSFVEGARVDEKTYDTMLADLAQDRANDRTLETHNFYALRLYQMYGERNPQLTEPSVESLREMGPKALLDQLRALLGYKRRVIYYGPAPEDKVLAAIDAVTPAHLAEAPAPKPYEVLPADETVIFVAPYDMAQADYYAVSRLPENYDPSLEPARRLFNAYFGGGMNAIVFQEIRESRSLAYSASSRMNRPAKSGRPYTFYASIATQADKLPDAMDAFEEIIENMPESPAAFGIARKSELDALRTKRTIKDQVAWAYINALDLGVDTDPDEAYYRALSGMTLDDVKAFQQKHVKGRTYRHAVLAPMDKVDLEALRKKGKVVILNTEDIFGY